jgi:predicted nucleic acid-binding protein
LPIDLAGLVRRRKPEQRTDRLTPREAAELVSDDAFAAQPGRPTLVPDTTVYIHQAAGRLPRSARRLVEGALMFHCSVCLAELASGLAHRDVSNPPWTEARDHFDRLFSCIPDTRLLVPDREIWIDAALIAGALARTQQYRREDQKECLNDALIYLTASKADLPVLTENRGQFDLIQQLAPEGRFIHYLATA